MSYVIRPATVEDVEKIIDAHLSSIRELGPGKYSADVVEGWAYPREKQGLRDKILSGKHFMSVAVSESQEQYILGFSNYTYDEASQTHRVGLYVRGTAARRGIGAALFRAAEQYARQFGAKEIHSASSLVAHVFYKKMGYFDVDEAEHVFKNGAAIQIVNMKKVLER